MKLNPTRTQVRPGGEIQVHLEGHGEAMKQVLRPVDRVSDGSGVSGLGLYGV